MITTKQGYSLFLYGELIPAAQEFAQKQMETKDEIKLISKLYTRSGQPYIGVDKMHLVTQ